MINYHDDERSCWNCQRSDKSPGFNGSYDDPPEPPECACNCAEPGFPGHLVEAVYNEWEVDISNIPLSGRQHMIEEIVLAELCGHYKPLMIDTCGNCKKEINLPVAGWRLWSTAGMELVACCSIRCVNELDDKFEQDFRDSQINPESVGGEL